MIFVVGGAASGKRTYVRSLGFADDQIADAVLDDRPVLCNAQDVVARLVDSHDDSAQSENPAYLDELIEQMSLKDVVTCDEMGAGVIPLTPRDRRLREAVGYLCVALAKRADTVVRMVCGIPVFLKGEDPR